MNATPNEGTEAGNFEDPERAQARKRLLKSLLFSAPSLTISNVRAWVVKQGLGIMNPEETVEELRTLGFIDVYQSGPALGITVKDAYRARKWVAS
jgi:hypothetical protein